MKIWIKVAQAAFFILKKKDDIETLLTGLLPFT